MAADTPLGGTTPTMESLLDAYRVATANITDWEHSRSSTPLETLLERQTAASPREWAM